MFKKVLIANRGEIAVRIARTLRDMGIKSVAVYSDADAGSPHVAVCDEAVRIGPAAPRESYLSISAVIDAAKKSGCDAIHPGYGFLSENPVFSKACKDNNIVFVGPDHVSMGRLGDKLEAKKLAKKLGIPLAGGSNAVSGADAAESAAKLGFPVLVKAAAGGGGKGMRRVNSAAELAGAVESAVREAESAFSDGRVFIEKLINPARHIEIQVLSDGRGNVMVFPERECSLQRRHQKIIEESPSSAVSPDLRSKLQLSAGSLVNAASYCGAATVEFLIDKDGNYYFLEVNTRLQVEHPVTEEITGLDLVELQLIVASGDNLRNEAVMYKGNSIEARLYAEDPSNNFLPSSGKILKLRLPSLPWVRIDCGIAEGQEITPHYDPMIAKIISRGQTREKARARVVQAIREILLLGVDTNMELLVNTLESDFFRKGETYTSTIDMALPALSENIVGAEMLLLAALSCMSPASGLPHNREGCAAIGTDLMSPWKTLGDWKAA